MVFTDKDTRAVCICVPTHTINKNTRWKRVENSGRDNIKEILSKDRLVCYEGDVASSTLFWGVKW